MLSCSLLARLRPLVPRSCPPPEKKSPRPHSLSRSPHPAAPGLTPPLLFTALPHSSFSLLPPTSRLEPPSNALLKSASFSLAPIINKQTSLMHSCSGPSTVLLHAGSLAHHTVPHLSVTAITCRLLPRLSRSRTPSTLPPHALFPLTPVPSPPSPPPTGWQQPSFMPPSQYAEVANKFKVRPDDVFVLTFPKVRLHCQGW